MIQIDNLGVPRVGILNTFATVRMGSRYNDTLGVIWLSDSDLPNQDVWVFF